MNLADYSTISSQKLTLRIHIADDTYGTKPITKDPIVLQMAYMHNQPTNFNSKVIRK